MDIANFEFAAVIKYPLIWKRKSKKTKFKTITYVNSLYSPRFAFLTLFLKVVTQDSSYMEKLFLATTPNFAFCMVQFFCGISISRYLHNYMLRTKARISTTVTLLLDTHQDFLNAAILRKFNHHNTNNTETALSNRRLSDEVQYMSCTLSKA